MKIAEILLKQNVNEADMRAVIAAYILVRTGEVVVVTPDRTFAEGHALNAAFLAARNWFATNRDKIPS